jgi:hypothetical protein
VPTVGCTWNKRRLLSRTAGIAGGASPGLSGSWSRQAQSHPCGSCAAEPATGRVARTITVSQAALGNLGGLFRLAFGGVIAVDNIARAELAGLFVPAQARQNKDGPT